MTGTYSIGETLVIETTGNYDQAIAAISDKQLIQRVKNNKEAYVDHTSSPSQPKYREIGEVQAVEPYSNDFQFDEKMVDCRLYHKTIECSKKASYLEDLIKDKDKNRLPMTDAQSKLYIDQHGDLRSSLITSSPLVVHLFLNKHSISLELAEVCPKNPQNCIS